jgi:hypothetical protein
MKNVLFDLAVQRSLFFVDLPNIAPYFFEKKCEATFLVFIPKHLTANSSLIAVICCVLLHLKKLPRS